MILNCARSLADRLLSVLGSVVAPEQTCGVRGRFTGENVVFLWDLVDFTSETGTPAAILSLDQEKAFDRVNWQFLFRVLSHLGFGSSFVSWVWLLYSGIRSTVLINGYRSDFLFPSRGVRQGCPLSPFLYVLSIEVLAADLCAHPSIIGLSPPGLSVSLPVVSLYADNTSVISVSDAATRAVFETYSLFENRKVQSLTLASVRAFGLVRGVIVWMLQLPSSGRLLRSRSLEFSLVMVTWLRQTGALGWNLWRIAVMLGARIHFLMLGRL